MQNEMFNDEEKLLNFEDELNEHLRLMIGIAAEYYRLDPELCARVAFEKAAQSYSKELSNGKSFKNWWADKVKSLAKHYAASEERRKIRNSAYAAERLPSYALPNRGEGLTIAVVTKAMESLSLNDQLLIQLKYIEELSTEEIVKHPSFTKNANALKTQLCRARAALKKAINILLHSKPLSSQNTNRKHYKV